MVFGSTFTAAAVFSSRFSVIQQYHLRGYAKMRVQCVGEKVKLKIRYYSVFGFV